MPGTLPGGLPLYAAAWSRTGAGQVTDLEYSDGLSVVSLFVQRGTLAASMAGWRPVAWAAAGVFASGHSVTWAGLGYVYTMIADAPPQTVTQAVARAAGRRLSRAWWTGSGAASTGWLTWLTRLPDGLEWV